MPQRSDGLFVRANAADNLGVYIIVLCVGLAVLCALWRWSPDATIEFVCEFATEIVVWAIALAICAGVSYLVGAACSAGGL